MSTPSAHSDSNLPTTHSPAGDNSEEELEISETESSASSESDWDDDEVVFEFNALPPELKNMVWKEMSFLHMRGTLEDPYVEQILNMIQAQVSKSWYAEKGKPRKYFVGPNMDIIGLAELLEDDELKRSIVRELVIKYDVATDEETQAVAQIFRFCSKLQVLSLTTCSDLIPSGIEEFSKEYINVALNGLTDLKEFTLAGDFWDEVFLEYGRFVLPLSLSLLFLFRFSE